LPSQLDNDLDMNESSACPFCERITTGAVEHRSISAAALSDRFPLSPGHTLVVPERHEAAIFALSAEEQADLWRLVAQVRRDLQHRLSPDGFNIGINDGKAAGQTVDHAHVHVIPRFIDDVPDPRGGVRWVLPDKAAYWSGGAAD
jgi:diadenosine tetraphosphate (Ap4A) HIT family hydrolase